MKFLLCLILSIFTFSLYSKDNIKENKESNENGKFSNFLKNGPEEVLYSEDDDDDVDETSPKTSLNNVTVPTAPKSSKETNAPKLPSDSVGDWKNSNEEIDTEAKRIEIESSLKKLREYSARGNSSSIKQISRILLKHKYPEVRAEAARSLGRLKSGLKYLHKAIENDAYEVKQQAYRAIEGIGSRKSLKYFRAGINSSDEDIRISSFKGLGKSKTSQGRDLILRYGLYSDNSKIISAALEGLGNYSRSEDLDVFRKFLQSDVIALRSGAIAGLGNSKQNGSVDLLLTAYENNPDLAPEVIIALNQKTNLAGTLSLIKLLHAIKNENYQNLIKKELYRRKAFGQYAIVSNQLASMRYSPRPNSKKVTILRMGDVAKVKNITSKYFKAKMNNQIVEDRYFQLLAVNRDTNQSKRSIVQGWVFGPKIEVISLNNPGKEYYQKKGKGENSEDEDSEDEIIPGDIFTKQQKQPAIKIETKSDKVEKVEEKNQELNDLEDE